MPSINLRWFLIFGALIASTGYIYSTFTGSLGMILFCFGYLCNIKKISFLGFFQSKKFWAPILFFSITVVFLFHSNNISQGLEDISRALPLFIYPIIFGTTKPFNLKENRFITKGFSLAVLIFLVICLAVAIFRQVQFSIEGGPFNWYFFYRFDFLKIFDQHPTYIGMYTLLAIVFIKDKSLNLFKNDWVKWLLFLSFSFFILILGSRICYGIYLILVGLFIYKAYHKQSLKVKLKAVATTIISLIVLGVICLQIPIIKERIYYTIGVNYDYQYNDSNSIKNSNDIEQGRMLLWSDAFVAIKEQPFFGHGTGSGKRVLRSVYEKNGHISFLEKDYNTHSTYLETWLEGGFILLGSYVWMLFLLLKGSKSYTILGFFLIIVLASFTETLFLSKGLLFLSFFYCYFIRQSHE